jgi:branched-chain amino acid transport system substrate-binding protein
MLRKRTFVHFAVLTFVFLSLIGLNSGASVTASPKLQATTAPTMAATSAVTVMMNLPESPATGDPIPVGAIFDLTGPTADIGKPVSAGTLAYIDWLNTHGGIDGRPVKLISADYAYDVNKAQQLYTQFTSQDKVLAFMGWGTGDTEALRTKAADDQMPFASYSWAASLNDPSGKAPYNFLVGTTYSDQAVILLGYLASNYKDGKLKVAFLHNDSPFGTSPLDAADAFLKTVGGTSIRIPMPRGAIDFTAQIAQVQQFGATHVVFQNTVPAPAAFIKQAATQGLKVTYACLNYCADENITKLAGSLTEGMYGAIPFAPPTLDIPGVALVRQYTKAKGVDLDAAGLHYVQGWWSMAIFLQGIKLTLDAKKDLTGPNIKAALERLTNFDTGGVTPPITFTPTDHRGNQALRIYQVKDGKWQAVTDYIAVPKAN